jgi:hypothetical protein
MIIFRIYIYMMNQVLDNVTHHFSQGEQTQRGEATWKEVCQWNW